MTQPVHSDQHRSRVVLVNGSHLLSEMLEHVFRKLPDFEVIGVVKDIVGLERLLGEGDADWFIITSASDGPNGVVTQEIRDLRTRFPGTRILAIAPDGSEVVISWLEAREAHLERAPLHRLIITMRRLDQMAFRAT